MELSLQLVTSIQVWHVVNVASSGQACHCIVCEAWIGVEQIGRHLRNIYFFLDKMKPYEADKVMTPPTKMTFRNPIQTFSPDQAVSAISLVAHTVYSYFLHWITGLWFQVQQIALDIWIWILIWPPYAVPLAGNTFSVSVLRAVLIGCAWSQRLLEHALSPEVNRSHRACSYVEQKTNEWTSSGHSNVMQCHTPVIQSMKRNKVAQYIPVPLPARDARVPLAMWRKTQMLRLAWMMNGIMFRIVQICRKYCPSAAWLCILHHFLASPPAEIHRDCSGDGWCKTH